MDLYDPVMDNVRSFMTGKYDVALIKQNKVETFRCNNIVYYFDTIGRVEKSITFAAQDSIERIEIYRYSSNGQIVNRLISTNKVSKQIEITSFKKYDHSRLICDSTSPGETCTHWEYDNNGNLKKEIWIKDKAIGRTFSFDIDILNRRNRIVDRQYISANDTIGRLLSDRTLIYDKTGKLIQEEETVNYSPCFNWGSTKYKYDRLNRLVQIIRSKGLSQKIEYYDNGLIAFIITKGRYCGGDYDSRLKYIYTFRK